MQKLLKILIFSTFIFNLIILTHQQQTDSLDDDDIDDDDDCAFISGQHCDENGICKYCAMCIQSSCILSKTVNNNGPNNNCNTTQFGTTNLYDWYDYCLSSGNDENGSYCATSTECYQYRKSTGPSVTYAWHNLTCSPSTCMLVASNGEPPPAPVSPQPTTINNDPQNNDNSNSNSNNNNRPEAENSNRHIYYNDRSSFHNPAVIALTTVCCLVLLIALCWTLRLCIKNRWWPFTEPQSIIITKRRLWRKRKPLPTQRCNRNSLSSIPSSAPPSFSSAPPDMATIRHPQVHLFSYQPSIRSARSTDTSSTNNNINREPLPAYLSSYASPPKYEQAIVTQIRGLREESSSSSESDLYRQDAAPIPSMWVPVYFTQSGNFGRRANSDLLGFTPTEHTAMPSYWVQHVANPSGQNIPPESTNPFDDNHQSVEQPLQQEREQQQH